MLDCRSVYSICWDIFPGCIEKTILETSSPRLRWDISRWPVRRPRQHLQHLSCTPPWYARLCGPVVRLTTRCLRSWFGRPNHQIKRLLRIFQEESTTSILTACKQRRPRSTPWVFLRSRKQSLLWRKDLLGCGQERVTIAQVPKLSMWASTWTIQGFQWATRCSLLACGCLHTAERALQWQGSTPQSPKPTKARMDVAFSCT